jgi:signal transduction histidine kinase
MTRLFQRKRDPSGKKHAESLPWHVFKELEDSLNIIEDLEQIGGNLLGKIREIIPIKKIILLIYDQDVGRFKVSNYLGFEESRMKGTSFLGTDPLVKWLKVNKSFFNVRKQKGVFEFLSEKERNTLMTLGIELSFPLVSMNRLIGIIFIGPKESGQDFTKPELSLISSLTPQMGIALENALLYKEQRERFRRMSRADKLATIGELAAGAAHEIRNPLTGIKSFLQYLDAKELSEKESKILKNALEETDRIDDILSALLSFSRPSETKKEKIDLKAVLKESLDLMAFQVRKQKIQVLREFPASPVIMNADKSQLKQLFLNIFLNSLQAMKKGGELKVEITSPTSQDITIAVYDTGEGISEENLDKIFDPFFTTKKGGTGLGLSICYGIVQSHQGEIRVKSTLSEGTTAVIKFSVSL